MYVAFELGQRQWKLSVATESTSTPRQRTIAARDCAALGRELSETRRAWGLSPTGPMCSCYEAGRDGFWLHRVLTQQGIANVVVDSASIEVNRRKRRAKSDSLDGRALLSMLLRYTRGEPRVWSVVHVPTPAAEDRRHLHRELMRTRRDRARARNRIRSLLASQGVALATLRKSPAQLPELRTGTDGEKLAISHLHDADG